LNRAPRIIARKTATLSARDYENATTEGARAYINEGAVRARAGDRPNDEANGTYALLSLSLSLRV